MNAIAWLQIIALIPPAVQGAAEAFQAIAEATGRQETLSPEAKAHIKAECDAAVARSQSASQVLQATP